MAAVLIAAVFLGAALFWAVPLITGSGEIDPDRVNQPFAGFEVGLQNEDKSTVEDPQKIFTTSDEPCVNAANEILRTGVTVQVVKSPYDDGATETGYLVAWKNTQAAQQAFDKLRPALINCHVTNDERSQSGGWTRYSEIQGQLNPARKYRSMALMQYGNLVLLTQNRNYHAMPLWYTQVVETIKYFG